jgi:lipid A 3-O-deacylase
MHHGRLASWRALLAAALVVAAPLAAQPQPSSPTEDSSRWTGWRLYWENDTFAFGRSTDRHYTNGLRLALGESRGGVRPIALAVYDYCPSFVCPGRIGAERLETVSTMVLGQTMFTPHLITNFGADPNDRPFAGHLYGGVHAVMGWEWATEILGSVFKAIPETTVELGAGVLGAPALAGSAQSAIHVLRENRLPKGWFTQIGPEPTVQLVYLNRVGLRLNPLALPFAIEVTPALTGALGTVQTFAGGGVTLRAGFNLTGLATNIISATFGDELPPSWEISANWGYERRWWARNAFIDGGVLGGPPSTDKRNHTSDQRWGGELRLDPLTFTYTRVGRTQELASGPLTDTDHRFGSVSLAYTAGTSNPIGAWVADRLESLLFDVGFGMGVSTNGERARAGRAVRIAAGLDLGRWGVSGEMGGVADEARGPRADGSHEDLFFVNKGVSVWGAPLPRLFVGRPLVRVGVGKPLFKRQTLLGERIDNVAVADGWRPFFGLGWEVPLTASGQLSLGLETTWSRVSLTELYGDGPQGRFLTTLVGFKWRPDFVTEASGSGG